MKMEITNKLMQRSMCLFFLLGAGTYGCMFTTYILWWMGKIN